MVNDLILQQKNNLNLNLNPIYVDSNIIKATAIKATTISSSSASPTTATTTTVVISSSSSFVSPSKINIETKLLKQNFDSNNFQQLRTINCQNQINSSTSSSSKNLLDGELGDDSDRFDNKELIDQITSPILPPPPPLKLISSKFLTKTKTRVAKNSIGAVNCGGKVAGGVASSVSSGTSRGDPVKPLNTIKILPSSSNSTLKSNKELNITTELNNGGLIIDGDDVGIITNNLNWKFFDRVSLLDDELRDQESSGENNFDESNDATTSSQEVLLSKSNHLQKTSTTHHRHKNNKKDQHYIFNTQTTSPTTTTGGNSTIITNPHNNHHQHYCDKSLHHSTPVSPTSQASALIKTKTKATTTYVAIAMNSPSSPSTSAAVIINNNYTNSNHKNNINNNNISSNHNYHSINKKNNQNNHNHNHINNNNSNNINNNNNNSQNPTLSPTSQTSSSVNIIRDINQSGGSIGNLRNDTMIGSNTSGTSIGSQNQQQHHQGILGQKDQQQQQPQQTISASLKRNSNNAFGKSKRSPGVGGVSCPTTTTSAGTLNNNQKHHSVFNGLPDNGIGFHLGLYGWRKKCLYMLLLILMLLIIVNLVLTLWILKVMEFSSEGMGQLKIVPGGIQLSGQALIMDLLRASVIRSKHGQPIILESSRNFSINTRDSNGILENHLFLGHDKLECLANGFRINDTTGKNLFSVNRNEVVIGAHHLRIDGEGGVTFRESVQTPHVRAEPSRELRLESPTRQLEMTAVKDINLQSRAGGIEISALDDVKLSSKDGSVRFESSKIFLPNLKPVKLLTSSSTSFHENFDKVTQLCACSNGKLFLASPKGHCSDDEGTICR